MADVTDRAFLKSVQAMIAEPDNEDIAVTSMTEIAPGMLLCRETDGEWVVYVNLEMYQRNPDFTPDLHLRERNLMPENIGIVQNECAFSIQVKALARSMVIKKNCRNARLLQPKYPRLGTDITKQSSTLK